MSVKWGWTEWLQVAFEVVISSWQPKSLCLCKLSLETWLAIIKIIYGQQNLYTCHQTNYTLSIWWRDEHAHDVACSPPGSSSFLGQLQPRPAYALWAWHCPGHTQKVRPETPPREAYYRGEAWCSVGGRGSYKHHQFTPPTMVDDTLYHDCGATVTICEFDARIDQSVPLPAGHKCTTIIVKQCEVRLGSETQCLQYPRSNLLCVILYPYGRCLRSKVNLRHPDGRRNRQPATRSLFTMFRIDNLLPNRWIISTCRRGAEMKLLSLTIRTTVRLTGL